MELAPADMPLPPLEGMLVDGKYRVVRLIGSGGMGTVWEARHEGLGHRLAIKFIKPMYALQDEARARFKIEARATAMLQTKHAVRVYDYGVTESGLPYIVMELLDGEPLADALTRGGPMEPAEAARVIGQAAAALTRAHKAGIVHRDLKPDNIFLARVDDDPSGSPYVVKLVDFGIAKIFSSEDPMAAGSETPSLFAGPTKTGTVIGTPNFMSPEQLTVGGPPTYLSDLWSLGACAYSAFTGRLPFEGEILGDIVLKVCAMPLPVPSQVNPRVPEGFDAWFARACARDLTKRYQSADELAQSLASICGLGAVRMATLGEDQVQYVMRPNPSYASATEDIPDPGEAMSTRTAVMAGLLLGVTLMVAVAAAFAWRDKWMPGAAEAATTDAIVDAGATRARDAGP